MTPTKLQQNNIHTTAVATSQLMLKTEEKRTLTELTHNEQEARAARVTAAELLRDDALARRDEVQRASTTDESGANV